MVKREAMDVGGTARRSPVEKGAVEVEVDRFDSLHVIGFLLVFSNLT